MSTTYVSLLVYVRLLRNVLSFGCPATLDGNGHFIENGPTIVEYAYHGCALLKSVVIKSTVITIGEI